MAQNTEKKQIWNRRTKSNENQQNLQQIVFSFNLFKTNNNNNNMLAYKAPVCQRTSEAPKYNNAERVRRICLATEYYIAFICSI